MSNLHLYEPPQIIELDTSAWLRGREAARYLGWSESHLYKVRAIARQEHQDPAFKVGKRAIAFRKPDLDALARWWSERVERTGEATC